ncbi:MAG: hypothetical protein JWQ88_1957 [Rhodoferax sp.]|nr:hypothetical protein [Rhodoferax sp.]
MAGEGGKVHIGISGWRYTPWRGVFYPPKLPQRQELAFASRMLPTLEINGSFYSLQSPSSYQSWHDETPDDFVFAVKGPRYLTHMLRLKNARVPLANFFASGVLALRRKLGPILWQFPANMPFDAERFDAFFDLLPRTTDAAATLGREHDQRLDDRHWLGPVPRQPLRHAVEIRHESFRDPAFIALLRRHKVAMVVADTAGRWPLIEDVTSDFVYLRLHGDKELYASGYDAPALDQWAARIDAWRRGGQLEGSRTASSVKPPRRAAREVFCYFDNDVKVHAPFDAAGLAQRLGVVTGLRADGQFEPPPGLAGPRRSGPAFKKAGDRRPA